MTAKKKCFAKQQQKAPSGANSAGWGCCLYDEKSVKIKAVSLQNVPK